VFDDGGYSCTLWCAKLSTIIRAGLAGVPYVLIARAGGGTPSWPAWFRGVAAKRGFAQAPMTGEFTKRRKRMAGIVNSIQKLATREFLRWNQASALPDARPAPACLHH
jgi:hypothetical protein